jgi:uncharacterized protein YegJ (DUF2314 family)
LRRRHSGYPIDDRANEQHHDANRDPAHASDLAQRSKRGEVHGSLPAKGAIPTDAPASPDATIRAQALRGDDAGVSHVMAPQKVGLKEMYQSKRLVDLIWRTEITFDLLLFVGLIVVSRHPNLLLPQK